MRKQSGNFFNLIVATFNKKFFRLFLRKDPLSFLLTCIFYSLFLENLLIKHYFISKFFFFFFIIILVNILLKSTNLRKFNSMNGLKNLKFYIPSNSVNKSTSNNSFKINEVYFPRNKAFKNN